MLSNWRRQFGGKINTEDQKRYALSPHWRDGKFQNLEETSMSIDLKTLPKLLYKQFFSKNNKAPKEDLGYQKIDFEKFINSEEPQFIWLGHSVILLRLDHKTIVIDPMLGDNASPIAPFPTKRFSKNILLALDELKEIDLMILSHDHYDHIDLESINRLKGKTKTFYTALGVKRHLVHWGVSAQKITEFDWWDHRVLGSLKITFTPSRHFSGRGISDRAKSLWGGWAFKTADQNIWFSGDGGYGNHFTEIGAKLGPFDFAFMECGQYNENWHQIHMYPEESVQAGIDAKAKKIMAVHWAGFSLAQHSWVEPIERFKAEADKKQLDNINPKIGTAFNINSDLTDKWWIQYI